ncbi:ATP-binding protein [Streptomyces sp. NBRC 109706]|uniref:ATP-binding protein n=1 Tax=Streptomyces sp. NBRC 109706 TaxID=1550035 RepID=UPI00131AD023|nr:ATP-binding protein [Streptomyces sp. NBRC 109706]
MSELLSNVLKHVEGRWCSLTVCQSQLPLVVVQVLDRSPVQPVVRCPAWDAESGRGLWLLREMADGFGCFRHVWDDGVVGKSVWFACRLDGPGSAPVVDETPVDSRERLRARLRARNSASEVNYRIKSGELP